MELKHYHTTGDNKEIHTLDEWNEYAKPMGGDVQWKDGRSAKELARYMTEVLPSVPHEIETALSSAGIPNDSEFIWEAEHLTELVGMGRGYGRYHDVAMWNNGVFVGIEAKADEPLDRRISDYLPNASPNRIFRFDKLCEMIFGDSHENHINIRYQLLTGLGGVLLEASKLKNSTHPVTAVFLILTFKKQGLNENGIPYYSEEKAAANLADINEFLSLLNRNPTTGEAHTPFSDGNGIRLFINHIEIRV